jgi:predicted nucleic-acid-binding protein
MIGIDTNVLVRFLVRDDKRQFERAQRLIKRESSRGETVLLSQLVLLEAEWVLRSRYVLGKNEILRAFSGLLDSAEFTIEDEPSVEKALFLWRDSSAEFADCLIGVRHLHLGCRETASFDARALRLPGFVSA